MVRRGYAVRKDGSVTITYCDACGVKDAVAREVLQFGPRKHDLCPACVRRLEQIFKGREWQKADEVRVA